MRTIHPYHISSAIAALLFFVSGCCWNGGDKHPSSQYHSSKLSKPHADTVVLEKAKAREPICAILGSNLTLVAPVKSGAMVQWYQDGKPIAGATGSKLVLSPVTTNHVGFYNFAMLTKPLSLGGDFEENCPVELQAMSLSTNGGPTVIWGKPTLVPMGNSTNICPGPYVAVAIYKPKVGFGWYPVGGEGALHVATDGSTVTIGCSKVEYGGERGDTDCATGSITVPNVTSTGVPISLRYRFAIYFPANCHYSNPHPISFTGFSLTPDF